MTSLSDHEIKKKIVARIDSFTNIMLQAWDIDMHCQ